MLPLNFTYHIHHAFHGVQTDEKKHMTKVLTSKDTEILEDDFHFSTRCEVFSMGDVLGYFSGHFQENLNGNLNFQVI